MLPTKLSEKCLRNITLLLNIENIVVWYATTNTLALRPKPTAYSLSF